MTRGGVVPGGSCRRMRLGDGRDLRDRGLDLRVRLEEDLDDADAGEGLRLDVLDVVDRRRQGPLVAPDDPVRHLRRGQAAVAPHRADDRDVDVGEDVDRRPADDDRRHEDDHDRENHEGVRPTQRETDDPHGRSPGIYSSRGSGAKRSGLRGPSSGAFLEHPAELEEQQQHGGRDRRPEPGGSRFPLALPGRRRRRGAQPRGLGGRREHGGSEHGEVVCGRPGLRVA